MLVDEPDREPEEVLEFSRERPDPGGELVFQSIGAMRHSNHEYPHLFLAGEGANRRDRFLIVSAHERLPGCGKAALRVGRGQADPALAEIDSEISHARRIAKWRPAGHISVSKDSR